jgi:23S rRNA (adenine2503-C2)-methyltransferase
VTDPPSITARRSLFSETPESLAAAASDSGWPRRIGAQVLKWVWERGVLDPAAMTDLSVAQRSWLAERFAGLEGIEVAAQQASDGTRKLLLGWPEADREDPSKRTECVMIPAEARRTACISSQIGCPVGCRFCASGLGFDGNLSPGRIVEQVFRLGRTEGVGRISHIVFMGMGEPLANLPSVTAAIRVLNAPWGAGISARRITVSTVGVPSAIRRFAKFELPVNLALSLHAPNDELRRRIIPWAEFASIPEILDACSEWFAKSGREITLEYLLLGGFNDRPEHARELASVAKRLRSNVNLIRWNEVKGMPFDRPGTEDVLHFQRILRERGVNTHIRASRGRDIAAACGQLRHEQAAASVRLGISAATSDRGHGGSPGSPTPSA